MKGKSPAATGPSKSKPMWSNASGYSSTSAFFFESAPVPKPRCNPGLGRKSNSQKRAAMHVNGRAIPKIPTRIRGLDEVLDGGLPLGRTTLVSGGPGSGKTVLGLEFLCRGAVAGSPGVFVTFEERAEAVRKNALSMGFDLAALEKAGKAAIVEA